jgi:hypothetical protein
MTVSHSRLCRNSPANSAQALDEPARPKSPNALDCFSRDAARLHLKLELAAEPLLVGLFGQNSRRLYNCDVSPFLAKSQLQNHLQNCSCALNYRL